MYLVIANNKSVFAKDYSEVSRLLRLAKSYGYIRKVRMATVPNDRMGTMPKDYRECVCGKPLTNNAWNFCDSICQRDYQQKVHTRTRDYAESLNWLADCGVDPTLDAGALVTCTKCRKETTNYREEFYESYEHNSNGVGYVRYICKNCDNH